MTLHTILHKLQNRWKKLRLQPIRVFCLHQVSDEFDPSQMWECDWVCANELKMRVLQTISKKGGVISSPYLKPTTSSVGQRSPRR